MASGAIIWDIKNKRLAQGPFPSTSDANTALRKFLSKSGTKTNDKTYAATPSDFEVVTVTLP